MTQELIHLKDQISAVRRHGRARYPEDLRAAVLEQLARWRSEGRPRSGLAKELGLDGSTLADWEKTKSAARTAKVKAVSLAEMPAVEGAAVAAVVVLPSGMRIEALSVTAAVEIARALA